VKLAWLAGAAAAAVVVVAAIDAVRRDNPPAPPAATTDLENRDELAAALTELGARGELTLHDGVCGETSLTLPGLERRDSGIGCAPLGARSPVSDLVARCIDGRIEVSSETTRELEWIDRGCMPAWRPDGALTAVYGGQVIRLRPCGSFPCIAIPLAELERAARLHPAIPDAAERVRPVVDGVAWITDARAAVAISPRLPGADFGPIGTVAFFEDGRLLPTTQLHFRNTGEPLAASPHGTYVTQNAGLILRRDGSLLTVPPHFLDARALAWSPDERFLALATRFAVAIVSVASLERYDRVGGGLREVTIPQTAADLAWR
jgi:hypothetical protein